MGPPGEAVTMVTDYVLALTAGLAALAAALALGRRPGASWVAAGVATSALGALVQLHRLGLGHAFNHNDLFHVVQAAGLVLYARGGRDLAEPATGRPA